MEAWCKHRQSFASQKREGFERWSHKMNLQGAQSKHSQPDEFYKKLRIIDLRHIWQEGCRSTNRSSGVHETLDMLPIKWIDSGDLGCEKAKGHYKIVFKYIYTKSIDTWWKYHGELTFSPFKWDIVFDKRNGHWEYNDWAQQKCNETCYACLMCPEELIIVSYLTVKLWENRIISIL